MRLSQLLSIYPQLKWGDTATAEVHSLCQDSRQVEKGSVFVAIRGHSHDGHDFIDEAVHSGAVALVVEDEACVPQNFRGAIVEVSDSRKALATLAAHFHGHPAEQLFCVGVTGTNGKTSTTYLIEAILNSFGWKTGVLGTIDHHLGEQCWETDLTTPGALALQKRLQEFVALGARAAVFEVSSIAIEQRRADNIPFDALVFANLSHDHLDYHGTMENYFAEKQKLFNELPLQYTSKEVVAVINTDDPRGRKLRVADRAKVWTYGRRDADFTFRVLKQTFAGSQFIIKTPRGDAEAYLPLPGLHNLYNATAAIAVGLSAGVSLDGTVKALQSFSGVAGRLQAVENKKGIHVFVDYAHTPDALRKVLALLNDIREQGSLESRIISVFGCGGDRDQAKRAPMGQVAAELSDMLFVTSDNPRGEDPLQIIEDIKKGLPQSDDGRVFLEIDRREAIRRALQMAREGDVVLIAGKGHEKIQIIGNEKLEFDDVKVAGELIH